LKSRISSQHSRNRHGIKIVKNVFSAATLWIGISDIPANIYTHNFSRRHARTSLLLFDIAVRPSYCMISLRRLKDLIKELD
jgi:hypothetical protein